MFMLDFRDIGWWYWLLTGCFLTAGIAGMPTGFYWAIGLTVVNLTHFFLRDARFDAFPVQIRIGVLLLLLLALPEPMQPLYWVPTIGAWARVIFGYCAMARIISLMPWNRSEPFTLSLVQETFFSLPARGNVMQGLPPAEKN